MSVDPAEVINDFHQAFNGQSPSLIARAPGRINLIGEHTDYHDGFVLPAAIDREVLIAAGPRSDQTLQVLATAYNEHATIDLRTLQVAGLAGKTRWTDYIAGTAWALEEAGHKLVGTNMAVRSDVPIGAGLASSACLEMAVARALCAIGGIPWDAVVMAKLARKAENAFVGVHCGIMDQLVSGIGVAGHALLLDCRSLTVEPVTIPADLSIVVMDTGIRRTLDTTEYAARRDACTVALSATQERQADIRTLRDVDLPLLESIRQEVGITTFRRAAHVIAENARPAQLATALTVGDWQLAGRLMNASHASLRDLYEVSTPELDLITDLAKDTAGCYGARMTGAGFGGSAIALVTADAAKSFVSHVSAAYRAKGPSTGEVFACQLVSGASILSI